MNVEEDEAARLEENTETAGAILDAVKAKLVRTKLGYAVHQGREPIGIGTTQEDALAAAAKNAKDRTIQAVLHLAAACMLDTEVVEDVTDQLFAGDDDDDGEEDDGGDGEDNDVPEEPGVIRMRRVRP